MNYKYLFGFLALYLFGSFFLRLKSGSYEPYPAVIFPGAGSISLKTDSTRSFNRFDIYGFNPSSSRLQPIEISLLLDPVPGHFQDVLLSRLLKDNELHVLDSITGNHNYHSWIRSRLGLAGLLPDSILVVDRKYYLDTKSRKVVRTEENNKYLIELVSE